MSLFLLAAASVALGTLPPQPFPPGSGCAIFLWTRGDPPVRVAMLSEATASLRIMDGKTPRDLPRLPDPGTYGNEAITIRLDLTLDTNPLIANGTVATGALFIDRPGQDELALSVGGVRACV
jgi:hypothetical protein